MDARLFFERVKLMRHFQREYFRTRSHYALQQSKALEREIDTEINRVDKLLNPSAGVADEPNLFNAINSNNNE